ncbi:TetR/AcrR family transcriptional regulator [Mycolicibacterium neoaurum]|uniref:TetR/AcrR family transcriptional regulator n=1 Tax=Mycolicibacterium neoaurum TaxID=1795 RepID=UPI002672990F|nr:TetR/AcrR family transcriptional regulator [Mycolicibacterium neoaurum]MDO3401692.1 TetR/AcrR family transcriptional regulator [Mycolicibacterium neoaurum]
MPSVTRTPTKSSNRGQKRADIERRLLDATDRLMAEGATFTELSVDRLAGAADMSRRTFYVYFQDKADLLRSLATQVFIEQEAALQTAWKSAQRDYSDLQTAVAEIVKSYRRHEALLSAVVETAAYDAQVGESYRSLMQRATAVVELVIETGKSNGTIRADLHTYEVAATLTWMVERACHQILRGAAAGADERLAESLSHIIWTSLYGAAPVQRPPH